MISMKLERYRPAGTRDLGLAKGGSHSESHVHTFSDTASIWSLSDILDLGKETGSHPGTAVLGAAGHASTLDLAETARDGTAWEVASTFLNPGLAKTATHSLQATRRLVKVVTPLQRAFI